MDMKKWISVSGLVMLAAVFVNACSDKKQPTEKAEETPRESIGPGNVDKIPAASALSDEVVQYYGQQREIPAEYKTEAAMRNGKLWDYLSSLRETELQDYLKTNQVGFDAFTKNPVALNGTPALIFRLLPDVMPHLFSDAKFEESTGYYKLEGKDLLPYGFAFAKAPVAPGAQPVPLLVNISCAACHTGRVVGADGQLKMLVGAPSTVGDINGFRTLLTQAVKDPAYVLEKFAAALAAKKDGELYGPDRIVEEKTDRAIFQAAGAGLLQKFKDGLLQKADYAAKTAGAFTLKNDLRLLANSPGHIDFPIAVALATAPVAEVLADPATALKKYFPSEAGVADIMSVWQQDKREFAQWDGNLKNKLTRNLGAELGIAGDPRAVNFPNGLLTTAFVNNLPAPAYPFKVDLVKAAEGRKVYEQACASCHETEAFMPIAEIGTDPGRAIGLTKDTRLLLTAALKAACHDKTLADCQAPDEEVVVPREENPGYISVPLTGIWARAPYLHNGSVPTIYHLLIAEERPAVFQLNDFSFDEKFLGFNWALQGQGDDPSQNDPSQSIGKGPSKSGFVVRYDTQIPGYGNQGHSDIKVFNGGIDFRKDRRKLDSLLEYLKTL